jgi:hypothetical protein
MPIGINSNQLIFSFSFSSAYAINILISFSLRPYDKDLNDSLNYEYDNSPDPSLSIFLNIYSRALFKADVNLGD